MNVEGHALACNRLKSHEAKTRKSEKRIKRVLGDDIGDRNNLSPACSSLLDAFRTDYLAFAETGSGYARGM